MGDGLWFIVHEFLLFMGYLFFFGMLDNIPTRNTPRVIASDSVAIPYLQGDSAYPGLPRRSSSQ
jgi:hypothetical protein